MLYEDAIAVASLAPDVAVKGHVIVQPKRPVTHLSELSPEESAHLFTIASYAAAILFQGIQAEGTNILCNEEEEVLTIHVIARRQDDKLDFSWQGQEVGESVMNDTLERLTDLPEQPGPDAKEPGKTRSAPSQSGKEEGRKEAGLQEAEERENELIKQLIRIP